MFGEPVCERPRDQEAAPTPSHQAQASGLFSLVRAGLLEEPQEQRALGLHRTIRVPSRQGSRVHRWATTSDRPARRGLARGSRSIGKNEIATEQG